MSAIRMLFVFACLGATVAMPRPVAGAAGKRPNILFVFTDDQRADAGGALGNPVIGTPTLDSLARRGFVFRNAYCLGSNVPAVCLPSRNMLMSGRAYFRWQGLQASPDEPNLPVAMKQAGYVTYHHGKRGNTAVLIQAKFDVDKYLKDDIERESGEPGQQIVDEAIAWLKDKRDNRPFLMYLAFGNPHDPRVAAKKYLDLYERDRIPLPKNFLPLHPFNNGEQLIRDELLAPWPRTPDEIRRHLHEYYAVMSGFDHHLGRLLGSLKELGLDGNTIIVYASDNGLALGSHGLMGKQSLYEHSAKVPLIVAGAGIAAGGSDALVYLMDLLPTFCEFAGAPIPPGLDGKGLKGILDGRSKCVRETLFYAYREVQRAVRDDRWKLIRYTQINRTQLFDLRDDPDEIRDLAADPAQAARIERMMKQLEQWQKQLGDTTPPTAEKPRDPTFTPPTKAERDAIIERWKTK